MHLSRYCQRMRPSPLPALLAKALQPGVLSFAVGLPATELLPRAALGMIGSEMLAESGGSLQYGLPHPSLRTQIASLLGERSVRCSSEQVFLCTGAQQALRLLAHLLLDQHGQVMLEEVVYDGIRSAIGILEPEIVAVPTDPRNGIDLAAVERHLEAGARPAFLYVVPEGHNPLGASLDLEKRHRLVDIARRFELTLVEDDACGWLTYGSSAAPALRALDDQRVIYVGSFSKLLGPGLRVGWVVVPEPLASKLSMLKQAADFDTATHAQHLVAGFLAGGGFGSHLVFLRKHYEVRRDALVAALERHMPEGVRWTVPKAGLYLWLELPAGLDATELLDLAIEEEKVAFSPGVVYATHLERSPSHCLRLSFGNLAPEQIEEGAARLGRAVERQIVRCRNACEQKCASVGL